MVGSPSVTPTHLAHLCSSARPVRAMLIQKAPCAGERPVLCRTAGMNQTLPLYGARGCVGVYFAYLEASAARAVQLYCSSLMPSNLQRLLLCEWMEGLVWQLSQVEMRRELHDRESMSTRQWQEDAVELIVAARDVVWRLTSPPASAAGRCMHGAWICCRSDSQRLRWRKIEALCSLGFG